MPVPVRTLAKTQTLKQTRIPNNRIPTLDEIRHRRSGQPSDVVWQHYKARLPRNNDGFQGTSCPMLLGDITRHDQPDRSSTCKAVSCPVMSGNRKRPLHPIRISLCKAARCPMLLGNLTRHKQRDGFSSCRAFRYPMLSGNPKRQEHWVRFSTHLQI